MAKDNLKYYIAKKKNLSFNRLSDIAGTKSRRLLSTAWEIGNRLTQNCSGEICCETTIWKIEEMATTLRDVDCEDGR
jgi:hypothetical protein